MFMIVGRWTNNKTNEQKHSSPLLSQEKENVCNITVIRQ